MESSTDGICVAIRMRPMNERELSSGQLPVFRCIPQHNAISQLGRDGQALDVQTYQYDKVFDESTTSDDVYKYSAKKIVQGVANGINGTIFAYGQTSSGKTHTMIGDEKHPGVLELSAADIFKHINDSEDRIFLLRVSFVEIYNEIIRDLLSDSSDSTVSIREDPKKGVFCEAIEQVITDYESIIRCLKKGTVIYMHVIFITSHLLIEGLSRRTVESTAMNETSSRSHTIFK